MAWIFHQYLMLQIVYEYHEEPAEKKAVEKEKVVDLHKYILAKRKRILRSG